MPPPLNGRWKRIGKTGEASAFLQAREPWCVSACSRYLRMDRNRDHLWKWPEKGGPIEALILHSKRTLIPLLDGRAIAPPDFMEGFIRKYPLHAVQGLREDVEQLEAILEGLDSFPTEIIDYDLMTLDGLPPAPAPGGPPGLILRRPEPEDMDDMFILQSSYEREEVLPRSGVFDPAVCRANLERIVAKERTLVAELDSHVVGKINTSASSFSRYQIGGVYVHPAYRGRGIGFRMAQAFARELLSGGRGLSLFVKKRNNAARRVYLRAGFTVRGAYRISYYS